MHSPVLINADPAYDPDDSTDDWLYESDDYYDDVPPLAPLPSKSINTASAPAAIDGNKRRRDAHDPRPSKRRRVDRQPRSDDVPPLTLSESVESAEEAEEPSSPGPPVVWRKDDDRETHWPVLKDWEGERVALLVDWRERCRADGPRTASPEATMVVRGGASADGVHAERAPAKGSGARRKCVQGTADAAKEEGTEAPTSASHPKRPGAKKRKQRDDEIRERDDEETHRGVEPPSASAGAEFGSTESAQEEMRRSKRVRTTAT